MCLWNILVYLYTSFRLVDYVLCFTLLSEKQNEGPVCAFDQKCGLLSEFSSKDEAQMAGYKVAHCGACAFCSTWNDLELQYSTRVRQSHLRSDVLAIAHTDCICYLLALKKNLASRAQQCGIKTLGGTTEDLQQCLVEEIGWTEDCAWCWAEDMVCTKK